MCVLFCLWLCALFPGRTAVLEEDFATDPLRRGWTLFGDATLFAWDAAGQVLSVTWDSSHSNSFFSWPLGTILSGADDFSFAFDLRLKDILAGSTPGKSNEFEIAVGLVNFASATNANAFRGAGQSAAYGVRNLVEFDYFPDAGFGDTFATTVISTNNRIFPAHNFPLTLSAGDTFRITIAYSAADRTVRTVAARNGAPFGMPPDNSLGDVRLAGTPDFRVDAFAVTSYSDAVQLGPPSVHGSVLAHGIVDNVRIVLPGPPLMNLRIQPSWTPTPPRQARGRPLRRGGSIGSAPNGHEPGTTSAKTWSWQDRHALLRPPGRRPDTDRSAGGDRRARSAGGDPGSRLGQGP